MCELKCRVGSVVIAAIFISETEVSCPVAPHIEDGSIAVEQAHVITVANWGADFYSAELAGGSYEAATATAMHSPPPPPPDSSDDSLSVGAIAAIAASLSFAILMCLCVYTLINREKRGKPIFRPLEVKPGSVVA